MKSFSEFFALEQSNALTAYHTSPTPFEGPFDIDRIGSTNDIGYSGRGFYFTPNYKYAISDIVSSGGFIRNHQLNLKNPYTITDSSDDIFSGDKDSSESEIEFQNRMTELLKSKGHDGVIRNSPNGGVEEIVVFSPDDIVPISDWVDIRSQKDDD